MSAWGQITDLVLLALAEIKHGMYHDVAFFADVDPEPVRKALHRMASAKGHRKIHIDRWESTLAGARNYPRAVYALGHKKNAPRPKPKSHTAAARDYSRRAQAAAKTALGRYLPQKDACRAIAKLRSHGIPI